MLKYETLIKLRALVFCIRWHHPSGGGGVVPVICAVYVFYR
jgi:hypothetical protein